MIKQEQRKQKAANTKSTKGSKSELQKQKQPSHSEWFDPKKYDTKQVRHPPVVKKVLPADAEIYCIKPDTPINVYAQFCQFTAKSKFSLISPLQIDEIQ